MDRMLRHAAMVGALVLGPASIAEAAEARPAAEASRSGFKVVVLVTTDADWREKWNSSSDSVPHFGGPGVMKSGDTATVLTLFSNPRLKNGQAALHCDLTVINPDGTSDRHPPQPCFEGPIPGGPHSLHMAGLEIGFQVSPTDLSGLHGFEIGVTDVHAGVRVPVKVAVEFATGRSAT